MGTVKMKLVRLKWVPFKYRSLISSQYQRLPQFNLPYFTPIIFDLQYWRDSFETAIHNNCNFADVQKFIYLKSLLESDATNVIN